MANTTVGNKVFRGGAWHDKHSGAKVAPPVGYDVKGNPTRSAPTAGASAPAAPAASVINTAGVKVDPTTGMPTMDLGSVGAAIQAQQAAAAAAKDPLVYMGDVAGMTPSANAMEHGAKYIPAHGNMVPTSMAQGQFFDMWEDPEQRKSFSAMLVAYGLIDPKKADDYATLQKAWNTGVDQAAQAYAAHKKWTPVQALQNMGVKGALYDDGTGSKGTHSTATYITKGQPLEPLAVKNTVNSILQQVLGRDANDGELGEFANMLNTAIAQHPTVNTVVTNLDADGNGTQTSTPSGGVDPKAQQQSIIDKAKQKPDYGAFQAASTYMNALYSLLGSSSPHGGA